MVRTSSVALALSLVQASAAWCQNIDFSGTQAPIPYRCISNNINVAQVAGLPNALNRLTPPNAAAQTAVCAPLAPYVTALNRLGANVSCDVYPFASSTQLAPGGPAQAMIVPATENNSQGGRLTAFYNNTPIANGGPYTVSTSNVPAIGGGPGQVLILPLPGGFLCAP
jgi:hypothetical protein